MRTTLAEATVAAGADAGLYPVAFAIDTGFGRAVGVDLAAALDADPAALVALLHREERPLCLGMRGARLVEFTGGRLAARRARTGIPGADGPTLRGDDGMPAVPGGASISISHSRRFAVALATTAPGRTVGIDIEALDEDRALPLLAERILSEAEHAADRAAEPIAVLRRLSLKEAAYKALFPRLGPIPLRAITVLRARGTGAGYRILTPPGHGQVAAASLDRNGHVLSFARAG